MYVTTGAPIAASLPMACYACSVKESPLRAGLLTLTMSGFVKLTLLQATSLDCNGASSDASKLRAPTQASCLRRSSRHSIARHRNLERQSREAVVIVERTAQAAIYSRALNSLYVYIFNWSIWFTSMLAKE